MENGWFRYPALIGKTGKVKPNAVLVGGQERIYLEGRYELRFYEGRRAIFKDAGLGATEALLACERLPAEIAYRTVRARPAWESWWKQRESNFGRVDRANSPRV